MAEAGISLEQAAEDVFAQEQSLQNWQQHYQQSHEKLVSLRQQLHSSQHQQQLVQQQQTQLVVQEQRIRQRQQELQVQALSSKKKPLQEQLELAHRKEGKIQQALQTQQLMVEKGKDARQQAEQQLQSIQQQKASLTGQLKTLQQWLPDVDLDVQALGVQTQPLSELLQIEAGWEQAVELVLGHLAQALCVNADKLECSMEHLPPGKALLFDSGQKVKVEAGSLATLVSGPSAIRSRLNTIKLAESEQQLRELQAHLLPHQSVILPQGLWAGPDWLCRVDKAQGQLAIRAELNRLEVAKSLVDQEYEQQQQQVVRLQQELQSHNSSLAERELELRQQQSEQSRMAAELNHLDEKIRLQHEQTESLQQELEEGLLKAQELEQELMLAEESVYLLQEQVDLAVLEHDNYQSERDQMDGRLNQARLSRDQQQQQQHQLTLQINSLTNKVEATRQALERAQQQQEQVQTRCMRLEQELRIETDDQALREALEQQLELKIEAEQACAVLSEQMKQAQQTLIDLKQQEQQLLNQQSQLKQKQDALSLDQQTARVRAESATESLQEMEQPLKDVLEQLPDDSSEPVWQERLESIGRSVSRLGPINLAAIEEYEQCSERKQYLDQQNNDLVQALETLENAIRRIDRECRTRFKETYDKVNADLKMLFPKVFGGGMAYLELTGDDMLETGVTIMARPPGKRNATIHLLSGGEKALTALSLVFAIFRLNPAPFCMLDEVDAPLDDANVGRFCNLVREMAETVQFIYISHNKITMEMADQLAGVTMHEPGVSRLVAVDVDEAVALAQVS